VKDGESGDYRDETDWHNIVLWRAEKLAEYLKSGVRVYVEGRLQTRSWQDQNGNRRYATQVVAEQVILLSGSNGTDRRKTQQNGRQAPSSGPPTERRFAGSNRESF
jgi:single-strand DNA-binding protein